MSDVENSCFIATDRSEAGKAFLVLLDLDGSDQVRSFFKVFLSLHSLFGHGIIPCGFNGSNALLDAKIPSLIPAVYTSVG